MDYLKKTFLILLCDYLHLYTVTKSSFGLAAKWVVELNATTKKKVSKYILRNCCDSFIRASDYKRKKKEN